MKVAE